MASKARELANLGNAYSDGALSNRNLIINGAMQVAQRGTSFSGVGGSSVQYTLDRWVVREATDAVVDVSQAADSPSTDLFKYCFKLDVTTADASIGAGQVCTVQHRIEGQDLVLAGFGTANAKQLTLSFWHKHTKTGTYSVGFTNHNGTRAYPTEYTQSVSNTWEKSTVTFTADTTGTWATDNTLGMIIYFSVAAGTDFHATVNAWTGANDFASANQVNALDSTSNSFRITGVQLEVGDTATPFEHRSYGQELALCQRYYQRYEGNLNGNANDGAIVNTAAWSGGANYNFGTFYFITAMRAGPTLSWSDAAFYCNGNTTSSPTVVSNGAGLTRAEIFISGTASDGSAGWLRLNQNGWLAWDAEL